MPFSNTKNDIKIWDWPSRIAYLLTILTFAAAVGLWILIINTHHSPELIDLYRRWHRTLSWVLLGFLLFRIIWGFFGSYYVRFTQFIKGPSDVWLCLKGQRRVFGHNPVEGWLLTLLLISCTLQLVTGLFVREGLFFMGNLSTLLPHWLEHWIVPFRCVNMVLLLTLAVANLIAILFGQFWLGNNFFRQILMGTVEFDNRTSYAAVFVQDNLKLTIKALVIAAICVGAVLWLKSLSY